MIEPINLINRKLKSDFFKKFSFVLFANLTTKCILFLVYYILAKDLTIVDYGRLILILSTVTLLNNISSLGLNVSITKFSSLYKKEGTLHKITQLFSTTFINIHFLVVALLLFLFLFEREISNFLFKEFNPVLVRYCGLGLLFSIFGNMYLGLYTGLQEFKKYFYISVVPVVVSLLLVLIVNWYNIFTIRSITIIFVLSPLSIVPLLLLWGDFKYISLNYNTHILKEIYSFSKWISLQSFLLIIQSKLDTYLLAYFTNPQEVSYYDIAFKIQGLFLFVAGSYNTVLLPRYTSITDNTELRQYTSKTIRLSILISICLVMVVIVAPFFLTLLFGDKYNSSVIPLRIMLFSLIPHIWIFPFNGALLAKGKSKSFFIAVLLQLLANVFCSFFLLPILGAIGASISYLLVNVIALSNSLFYYNKFVRNDQGSISL